MTLDPARHDRLDEERSGVSRRSVLAGLGGAVALGTVFSPGTAQGAPASLDSARSETFADDAVRTATPDAQIDKRVDALMKQMTFAEKVGQLQLTRKRNRESPQIWHLCHQFFTEGACPPVRRSGFDCRVVTSHVARPSHAVSKEETGSARAEALR